jgi:transposase InsO family protein
MLPLARAFVGVASVVLRLAISFLRSTLAVRAENLVLRRQLAWYIERGIKPTRVDHASRVSLALLTRLFDWRDGLVVVRPSTVVRWHRLGWRIFWRLKCRAGRPRIPPELRSLIRRMAAENPLWGEERIANELLVKLGIRVSPRTVGNQYLIHDRDKIFARHLDDSIGALGIKVLRSPIASPKVNSICERFIGTIRRECLDWMIPLSEAHLRSILREWTGHYNHGRPHSALGPGVPDPPEGVAVIQKSKSRHRLAAETLVLAKSILGGLHHEYSITTASA